MFTLRIVDQEQGVNNVYLGTQYNVVNKQINPDVFNSICKEQGINRDSAFLIVSYQNSYYPICYGEKDKRVHYYIVTENGNTYEKL